MKSGEGICISCKPLGMFDDPRGILAGNQVPASPPGGHLADRVEGYAILDPTDHWRAPGIKALTTGRVCREKELA